MVFPSFAKQNNKLLEDVVESFILYGFRNNKIRYGIQLNYEARPPFSIDILSIDEKSDFIMVFESPFVDLKRYGEQFIKLCEHYPQRGDF